MGLRAVIFDYGMVLSAPPAAEALAQILRITALDESRFHDLYWADRHAFDEGKLTGLEFWRKVGKDAGLQLSAAQIEELADWDARMWSTENPPMLAWQRRLKESGLKTAILSNMGDNIHDHLVREFEWLANFDALVWSYQLGIAKPDEAIYRYTLKQLGVEMCEALFLDDKQVNVDAARSLGMKAAVFTTVERLRDDLVAMRLDGEVPLPETAKELCDRDGYSKHPESKEETEF